MNKKNMNSCLGIRIKKTKEMFLPEMNEELLIEILIKLPVKSLMRFKCVSKLWLSLISSRYLTNLFLKTSQRRRRFYVYLLAYLLDPKKQTQYTLSSSHYHHSDTTSVDIRIDQDLTTLPIRGGYFVSSVRGLTCFRNGRRLQICNINTRQVVELPIIEGKYNEKNVWSYFGYESVNDEYKVLNTVWEMSKDEEKVVRSEHHVLSLGHGASWKKTQNHIHHRPFLPYSGGLTINNVLYYEAWTDAERRVLMSFDFRSEEFKLIELPFMNIGFMNYKGKVAVFRYNGVLGNGSVDVWVLEEEDKSQWSDKKTFVLPFSQMNFNGDPFMGGYGNRSGQIWLRKSTIHQNQPISFLIYDMERNEIIRRIETRRHHLFGSFKGFKLFVSKFWDDIESIMYLET